MNTLFAKIRARGNQNKYKKILSDEAIYSRPNNLKNSVPYNSDHLLDEDSWYYLDNFSSADYCIGFLRQPVNTAEYDTLEQNFFSKIDFLVSYQNRDEFFFQNITASQVISRKMIWFGDQYRYEDNSKTIAISDPDAIYLRDQDTLYFKKLSSISGIFRGIDMLYREATLTETNQFLNSSFIELDPSFTAEKVSKPNLRRIALALNTLSNLQEDQISELLDYTSIYCPTLERNGNRFQIRADEELKKVLYGIEQRYYTTEIGDERRCANSIIRIN